MEGLTGLLIFMAKLLLLVFLVGLPFLLIIVFIADKVYKKIEPKYEELKDNKDKGA